MTTEVYSENTALIPWLPPLPARNAAVKSITKIVSRVLDAGLREVELCPRHGSLMTELVPLRWPGGDASSSLEVALLYEPAARVLLPFGELASVWLLGYDPDRYQPREWQCIFDCRDLNPVAPAVSQVWMLTAYQPVAHMPQEYIDEARRLAERLATGETRPWAVGARIYVRHPGNERLFLLGETSPWRAVEQPRCTLYGGMTVAEASSLVWDKVLNGLLEEVRLLVEAVVTVVREQREQSLR